MLVTLKKWGNNAAIRLPSAIMQVAQFELDQQLDVRVEDGKVIIERVDPNGAEPPAIDIAQLLAGVKPEDAPGLVSLGGPVGAEEW